MAAILDAKLENNVVPLFSQLQHAFSKPTNLAGYFDI